MVMWSMGVNELIYHSSQLIDVHFSGVGQRAGAMDFSVLFVFSPGNLTTQEASVRIIGL